jgi:hypothetical protein
MFVDRAKKHTLYSIASNTAPDSALKDGQYENTAQPAAVCRSCSGTGWEIVVDKGCALAIVVRKNDERGC